MTTLCLHMIVRDEAPVIARCLRSVLPHIVGAVIVDTGSVDGTVEIINHVSECRTYHSAWSDFATNRTEGLALARLLAESRAVDYLITIDADEELVVPDGFVWPELTADAYEIEVRLGDLSFTRHLVTRAAFPWIYRGVVHEDIALPDDYDGPAPVFGGAIPGVYVRSHRDGARERKGNKYDNDAAALRVALAADPDNARLVFYLAQSLRDGGHYAEAAELFERRAHMANGFAEEQWYAAFALAMCKEAQGLPAPEVLSAYMCAYQSRPTRAEPLLWLENYFRRAGYEATAQLFGRVRATMPRTTDKMFVQESAYLAPAPMRIGFLSTPRKGTPLQYTITSALTTDALVTDDMIRVYTERDMVLPASIQAPGYDPGRDHENPQARALIDLATAWDGAVCLCEDDILFARDWCANALALLDVASRALKAPVILCAHHMHEGTDLFDATGLRAGRYAIYRQSPRSWPNGSQMLVMHASTALAYAAALPCEPIRRDGERNEWGFDVRLYQYCAAGNAALVFTDPCLCMHMHTIGSTWWPDRDERLAMTKRFMPVWR